MVTWIKRRGRTILWVCASLLLPVILTEGFLAPNVQLLRDNPVSASATVTDSYIDGFGGDPTVDYRFDVSNKTYTGSGTGGELGNGDVMTLKAGQTVNIQYALNDPTLSCTCKASTADDWRLPHGRSFNPVTLLFAFPFLVMIGTGVRRRHKRLIAEGKRPPKDWRLR
jgi:hypothetical protein